jgi:pyruvate formate lyase activating enzyme
MNAPFVKGMAEIAMKSGGCVKFDIKSRHDEIHQALCGVSNRQTLENVKLLSPMIPQRLEPPLMVCSTLLVPGYVDEEEVGPIASFLAELNPDIPYRLLAFHPQYRLTDLPSTSKAHANRCRKAAEEAGLKRISVGNIHLLGDAYR